jgi:hypothetical protein
MSAALHTQAALMLRAPWQWSRNDGRLWAFWVYAGLAALVVGAPSLALMFWAPGGLVSVLMCVLCSIGLLALWGVQFSTLLRLDHPHAARFVVGHGHALRVAALGLWLALVAFVGVIALVVLHQPDGDPLRALLVVVTAAGATLLCMAMALRWWVLWAVLWLPFPLFGNRRLRDAIQPLTDIVQGYWQAQPVLWTLLVLLVMATVLVSLFGKADAQHSQSYAKRENFRKIASAGAAGQKPTLAAYGRWGEVLGAPFQRLADAWLAHVIRRASPQRSSVMARAEVVLHGAQHWVRQLGAIVAVQLVVLIGLYVLLGAAGHDVRKEFVHAQSGLSIGLACMALSPLVSLPGALWGSRREQALLVLLPGMPQGRALNQALARHQLTQFVLVWVAALPAFATLAWANSAPQVWAFFGATLPLAAMLWRDASRLRAASPTMALVPYLLFMALGLSSLLLLRWQPGLLLPWALGIVLLTAALLAWRWRKLSRWPQALPAGRLG